MADCPIDRYLWFLNDNEIASIIPINKDIRIAILIILGIINNWLGKYIHI